MRRAELLQLDIEVRTASSTLVDSSFDIDTSGKKEALASIEILSKRYRQLTETGADLKPLRMNVMKTRDFLLGIADVAEKSKAAKEDAAEIAEWLSIWLQSPEMFETWIAARKKSLEGNQDS